MINCASVRLLVASVGSQVTSGIDGLETRVGGETVGM